MLLSGSPTGTASDLVGAAGRVPAGGLCPCGGGLARRTRPGAAPGGVWVRAPAARRVVLSAEAELGDDGPVALDVGGTHVVEHPAPATDQHEQAAPAVVVLLVDLEVFGEVVDALGEEGDLHLGRPGVGLVEP